MNSETMNNKTTNSETTQNAKTNKILKIVIGILCFVVIALGTLLYLESKDKSKMVDQKEILINDKDNLIRELTNLKEEYAELQTNNDSLNYALTNEREKIELLLEKVKNTDARNLQKIRDYEKELGTLRAIMRGYIVQIDSLNTINQQLISENIEIKGRVHEIERKHEEISLHAEELTTKVQEGSVIRIRGMVAQGMTKKDKNTEKASNTTHIRTCLTLIENSIAQRGIKTVYIRVKGPDGIILTTNENYFFDVGGEQIIFSASRDIDYQGDEIELCIYYNFGNAKVMKGIYEVTAYMDGKSIGAAQVRLK